MIEIPITKGHQALIDDEDFEAISPFQWSYHGDGYVARGYHEDGKDRKSTRLNSSHMA